VANQTFTVRVRRRTAGWLVFLLIALIALLFATRSKSTAATGHGASINFSLKVVSTLRSVTVSTSAATFGNCTGGSANADTLSTSTALGYPNGQCTVGTPAVSFPITITYTGPPGSVLVGGSNATPSDGGTGWSLCNTTATCTGPGGGLPGADQYLLKNFGQYINNPTALTGGLVCDYEWGPDGCSAVTSEPSLTESHSEGIELIGPESSDDTSTLWTVPVTWMATAGPPG
jgi:hypothetical protein